MSMRRPGLCPATCANGDKCSMGLQLVSWGQIRCIGGHIWSECSACNRFTRNNLTGGLCGECCNDDIVDSEKRVGVADSVADSVRRVRNGEWMREGYAINRRRDEAAQQVGSAYTFESPLAREPPCKVFERPAPAEFLARSGAADGSRRRFDEGRASEVLQPRQTQFFGPPLHGGASNPFLTRLQSVDTFNA